MERRADSDAALHGVLRLADFEALARSRLEQAAFDYIAGGVGDELTLADNPAAWRRWRLRPRILVDVSKVDTSSQLLGSAASLPVGLAPVAFQHFAHPEAEVPSARAAAAAGVPYCLSTMSSGSLEEVAAAAGQAGSGPRWFQLYVHRDRRRAAELLRRAEAAGYRAIVLTADFPVAGLRERDARNRLPYPQSYGNFVLPELPDGPEGLLPVVIGGLNDASLSWADLAWLRGLGSLPLVVKGRAERRGCRAGRRARRGGSVGLESRRPRLYLAWREAHRPLRGPLPPSRPGSRPGARRWPLGGLGVLGVCRSERRLRSLRRPEHGHGRRHAELATVTLVCVELVAAGAAHPMGRSASGRASSSGMAPLEGMKGRMASARQAI